MSDDQHASHPGAAGSATSQVSTKARIQLTPKQYYTRLAVALLVGAIGGIIAGFLVARLSTSLQSRSAEAASEYKSSRQTPTWSGRRPGTIGGLRPPASTSGASTA